MPTLLAVGLAFRSLHGRPEERVTAVPSEPALVTVLLSDATDAPVARWFRRRAVEQPA